MRKHVIISRRIGNVEEIILECPKCNKKWLVRIYQNPGFSDHEHIICPACGFDFGEFRVDLYYDIEEFRGVEGDE